MCLCFCLCLSVCSTNTVSVGRENEFGREQGEGGDVGWSTGVCAWTSSSFSFCLTQHRHLFTSSPEALAFSAIIHNKHGVGRSGRCGDVTILSLFDEVV